MSHPHSDSPSDGSPRVLVADDDTTARLAVTALLRAHGMRVEAVDSGQRAVAHVRKAAVDLVLLDVVMPGLDGLDSCRLIKAVRRDQFVPVVLLTGRTDTESRVTGLRIGADDYICKPFDERELMVRVNNMLRIKRMHDEIQQAKERLATLATEDELTGLYNYRYLQERLADEFKRAERYREPLACVMLEVDDQARRRGRLGADGADEVIREVSRRTLANMREVDVATRFGETVFLLVLPSTNFPGALSLAERIREAVKAEPVSVQRLPERVSVSVGISVYPSRDIKTDDALVRSAEEALLQASEEGGDCVCVFQHQGWIYRPASSPPL